MSVIITRKDIAERAGVSVSVVSRALNNSGYVEGEKKKKILQIAEELGYSPNPVAMSLASRRTKQILFYCKDLKNAFNIETYEGMMEAAAKRGYMVMINGDIDFAQIKDLMVDGLIFPNEALTNSYLNAVGKNYYLPVVSMGFGSVIKGEFQKSVPVVESELWKGMENLYQYLWIRNHRKIALTTPYPWNHDEVRVIGWKQMTKYELGNRQKDFYLGICREEYPDNKQILGFSEEKGNSQFIAEHFFEKGEVAAEIFAEKKLDATAIMCFNDEMALGFSKQILKYGYRIPEDLSIVSFDNVYCNRYSNRKLTTLAMYPKKMGSKCVDVLLDMINGERTKYIIHVPTRIIEGDTVRSLRSF